MPHVTLHTHHTLRCVALRCCCVTFTLRCFLHCRFVACTTAWICAARASNISINIGCGSRRTGCRCLRDAHTARCCAGNTAYTFRHRRSLTPAGAHMTQHFMVTAFCGRTRCVRAPRVPLPSLAWRHRLHATHTRTHAPHTTHTHRTGSLISYRYLHMVLPHTLHGLRTRPHLYGSRTLGLPHAHTACMRARAPHAAGCGSHSFSPGLRFCTRLRFFTTWFCAHHWVTHTVTRARAPHAVAVCWLRCPRFTHWISSLDFSAGLRILHTPHARYRAPLRSRSRTARFAADLRADYCCARLHLLDFLPTHRVCCYPHHAFTHYCGLVRTFAAAPVYVCHRVRFARGLDFAVAFTRTDLPLLSQFTVAGCCCRAYAFCYRCRGFLVLQFVRLLDLSSLVLVPRFGFTLVVAHATRIYYAVVHACTFHARCCRAHFAVTVTPLHTTPPHVTPRTLVCYTLPRYAHAVTTRTRCTRCGFSPLWFIRTCAFLSPLFTGLDCAFVQVGCHVSRFTFVATGSVLRASGFALHTFFATHTLRLPHLVTARFARFTLLPRCAPLPRSAPHAALAHICRTVYSPGLVAHFRFTLRAYYHTRYAHWSLSLRLLPLSSSGFSLSRGCVCGYAHVALRSRLVTHARTLRNARCALDLLLTSLVYTHHTPTRCPLRWVICCPTRTLHTLRYCAFLILHAHFVRCTFVAFCVVVPTLLRCICTLRCLLLRYVTFTRCVLDCAHTTHVHRTRLFTLPRTLYVAFGLRTRILRTYAFTHTHALDFTLRCVAPRTPLPHARCYLRCTYALLRARSRCVAFYVAGYVRVTFSRFTLRLLRALRVRRCVTFARYAHFNTSGFSCGLPHLVCAALRTFVRCAAICGAHAHAFTFTFLSRFLTLL